MKDLTQDQINALKRIRNEIDEAIKKNDTRHFDYTFWCPKDIDEEKTKRGYTFYAYGGRVLDLFVQDDAINYFLFDKGYKTYFNNDEECNSIIEKLCSTRGSELLKLNENDWEIIIKAFKSWAEESLWKGNENKRPHLERKRETAIAHNNNGNNTIKILEMESRIKNTTGKKPDLIGVRRDNGELIFSYIEYKCTTGAMEGPQSPIKHYEDMKTYFNKDIPNYFVSYDKCTVNPMLMDANLKDVKKEIIFLFSHVGTTNQEQGISYRKVYNGIKKIKEAAENDGMLQFIRIVLLKDEFDLITLDKIWTIGKALKYLEAQSKKHVNN